MAFVSAGCLASRGVYTGMTERRHAESAACCDWRRSGAGGLVRSTQQHSATLRMMVYGSEMATNRMCKVSVVQPNGKQSEIQVPYDSNLRQALKAAKFDIYTLGGKIRNCGGNGVCGTCIVDVKDTSYSLTPRTMKEDILLEGKPVTWRLSCRANVVQDGCEILLKPQASKTTQF
ncbi:Photosynthetic NDH subunit of subcomplex B 3, chloroplastic [Porphyridium purpureum]|uniref:Photosynthetic NDH subunit of subcomplex B 3, chloroplastic n=1 Tax=Porphyridium purpureum TaxID=35688 RepID=A0A5J4YGL6_PORPP|nr:Photosynthetic NDH subunit of subcomplex B 3, chloroplastic [Porphyridium purpureum]KAA8492280.1 Photosynthetic NDH subunit of subcomplex B 3, chloroplastic [Porphyridium purpureum]|eukprot:POR5579..scf249_10